MFIELAVTLIIGIIIGYGIKSVKDTSSKSKKSSSSGGGSDRKGEGRENQFK